MIRTQVQFTEEQYKKLKEISQNNQKSLSAVIRQAVDQLHCTVMPVPWWESIKLIKQTLQRRMINIWMRHLASDSLCRYLGNTCPVGEQ